VRRVRAGVGRGPETVSLGNGLDEHLRDLSGKGGRVGGDEMLEELHTRWVRVIGAHIRGDEA